MIAAGERQGRTRRRCHRHSSSSATGFRSTAPAQTHPVDSPGASRYGSEPSESWGCWGEDAPGKVGAPTPAWAGAKPLPRCSAPPCVGSLPSNSESARRARGASPEPSDRVGIQRGDTSPVHGLAVTSPWWPRGQLSPGPSSLSGGKPGGPQYAPACSKPCCHFPTCPQHPGAPLYLPACGRPIHPAASALQLEKNPSFPSGATWGRWSFRPEPGQS